MQSGMRRAAGVFSRQFSSGRTTVRYPGAENAVYTTTLNFTSPQTTETMPCFRVLNEAGKPLSKTADHSAHLSKDESRSIYKTMLRLQDMDTILLNAQRQGRISFYLAARGEEAAIVGSTAALHSTDTVFTQYREGAGVLLHRGWDYGHFCSQCYGTALGHGKGRQMPIHYGDSALHVQTCSSPLATQIPHAVGAAYAMKMKGEKNVSAVFFGEGAASEGDFSGSLNFAATIGAPVLFLCRNNGWAISTPTKEQYRGDGIAARGVAYGVASVRVDGNDLLAVMSAVKSARKLALSGNAPVLLELLTYRIAHHSTSDDSTRYRSTDEMSRYENMVSPIERTRKYLIDKGWWTVEEETAFRDEQKLKIVAALEKAEAEPLPPPEDLFGDVYSDMTPSLRRQQMSLLQHLDRRKDESIPEAGTAV